MHIGAGEDGVMSCRDDLQSRNPETRRPYVTEKCLFPCWRSATPENANYPKTKHNIGKGCREDLQSGRTNLP